MTTKKAAARSRTAERLQANANAAAEKFQKRQAAIGASFKRTTATQTAERARIGTLLKAERSAVESIAPSQLRREASESGALAERAEAQVREARRHCDALLAQKEGRREQQRAANQLTERLRQLVDAARDELHTWLSPAAADVDRYERLLKFSATPVPREQPTERAWRLSFGASCCIDLLYDSADGSFRACCAADSANVEFVRRLDALTSKLNESTNASATDFGTYLYVLRQLCKL